MSALELRNYPFDGDESSSAEVVFGPDSGKIVVLIEIDIETSDIGVTVGNGPMNSNLPIAVPSILREVADIVEGVGNEDDFWNSLLSDEA